MKNYSSYIQKFTNIKALIIGDAMLDRYCIGHSDRICREAPVPIIDIENILEMPGGAANAAINLSALGAQTVFISTVGYDSYGDTLLEQLASAHVDISCILRDQQNTTMTKTRLLAKNQMLLRFDIGKRHTLSSTQEQKIMGKLLEVYPTVDVILISDYDYGVITEHIRNMLYTLHNSIPKTVVIDAKYPLLYKDFNASAIKPNFKEAMDILNISSEFPLGQRAEKIIEYREDFVTNLKSEIIAITLDSEGAVILDNKGNYYQTHTTPQPDSKAAGAGDTYVSTLTLALSSGAGLENAAELAARASYITLQKSSTAFCTQEELLESYNKHNKLLSDDTYHKTISLLQSTNKRIVFTNGCFDILHPGHVQYLSRAKSLGDVLIVGMNSDNSIKKIKGENRPINRLTDRIQVLSALSSVDYIIPFNEDTPLPLIREIKPSLYVKGGDYTKESLQETPAVELYGGKVVILPYVKEKSTTEIIQKITSHYVSPQSIV